MKLFLGVLLVVAIVGLFIWSSYTWTENAFEDSERLKDERFGDV